MRGRLGEKGARGKDKEAGKVEKRQQRESESESVGVQRQLLLADRKRGGWDLHSHRTLKMEEESQAHIKQRGIKDDAE